MDKLRHRENQAVGLVDASGAEAVLNGSEPEFSVLLVDDSFVSLRGMLRVLKSDWDTDIASGADEALYMVRRNQYSVLITDCDMPGKDGLWLLEQTRDVSPHTIRVLTSAGLAERFEAHIESGLVQCFLKKPVPSEHLLEILSQMMM